MSLKVQVSFDEGGVRLIDGAHRDYLPFASIADVELHTRALRSPTVIVTMPSGEKRTLFVGPAALEIHRGLVEHVATRRDGAVATPRGWLRGGRSLSTWLGSIEPEVGYRERSSAAALVILEDANADIESRAAAAHVLVRTAGGSDLVRTAKILLGRVLPPLVQVAARCADGGEAFVSGGVLAEAETFLSPADRADLHARREPATGSESHVAAALQAKSELGEEATRAATQPHAKRGAHGIGVDRDVSRWIGRSWGL